MKYELLAMQRTGGGAIVNCGSAFSLVGQPGGAFYTAANHAVVGLTHASALEYAKAGIRINAVAPGAIEAEGTRALSGGTRQALDAAAKLHPIGRIGRPEEIVEAVLFLASDAASFVLGAVVAVDGGLTAQ